MALYTSQQLISASNATYVTNTSGSITAADVRTLNTTWISSSAILSGSNTFTGNQTIDGTLTAQLPANYIWLGNGSGYSQAYSTSSLNLQGAQGTQGTTGAGTQGAQGVSGSNGSQGSQGIPGQFVQGSQGAAGSQGSSTQGVQGATGAQGGTGSQGTDGTQGATGQSITGTQGAQGFTGGVGQQGTQGIQGTNGVQGFDGTQGTQGVQGGQGAIGQGTAGLQGVQGASGAQGAQIVINNNNNNNILTATGTATLQGENNLTFDGSLLNVFANQKISGSFAVAPLNYSTANSVSIISYNADNNILSTGTGNLNISAATPDGNNTWLNLQSGNGQYPLMFGRVSSSMYLPNGTNGGFFGGFGIDDLDNNYQNNMGATLQSYFGVFPDEPITQFYGGGASNLVALGYTGDNTFFALRSGSVGKAYIYKDIELTGSLSVSGSLYVNGVNISNGGSGSINTGSFITTGSATAASQTVKGGFTFDTTYTTSAPYTSAGGGAKIIYVDYGAIDDTFVYWLDTSFANVTVAGTGITNGVIVNYSFGGSAVEVEITTGTITNGASYTFTGPALQTIEITGSLNASRAIKTFGPNGGTQQDQNGITVSANGETQQTFIAGTNWYLTNTNNNDGLTISNYENTPNLGESAWVFVAGDSGGASYGPAIAIQGNLGLTGSAINNAPIFLYRKTIISSSLDVSNTFTASLANGYTWVGNGNNRTSLVATSSFGGGTINTGSFATTGSNTFTGNQTMNNVNINSTNSGQISFVSGSPFIISNTNGYGLQLNLSSSLNRVLQIKNEGGPVTISGSSTQIQGVDFIPFSASLNTRINSITGSGGTTNTGSLLVTASYAGARINFTKGDGSGFTVPNNSLPGLVTLGTATTALQTIKGDFAFDTRYTASVSSSAQATNTDVLELSYDFVFGSNYDIFNYWNTNNYAGVVVSGSGVTNGTITGWGYGSNFEIYFTSGTATSGLTYSLTGIALQNIVVNGGLTSNYQFGILGDNGNAALLDAATGLYVGDNINARSSAVQGGLVQVACNNANLYFAATSSAMGGGLTWDGPQIATYDGVSGLIYSNIGFQAADNFTDGRVTILTPLSASAGFTASLANGYAWVGNSNNENIQVATSSFSGPQGAQGVAGQFVQGSQGAPGAQGATSQGAQGANGSQGADGQAIQGATGQSITGPQGIQGIQGASGTGGQQGAQGATGGQGTQGATGTNGYGYQGLFTTASLTLQTGTITFTTNTNVTSNAFQTGNRVRLAYQTNPSLYWEEGVITAYTTNQMTVLIDLVNVSGGTYSGFNIGITGQQGNIGLQGIQGTAGQAGATGGQGIQGNTGAGGQQGAQGATGTGTQGAQGASGTNGTNGSNGSQGAAGGTGAQGSAGGSGPQGSTGATGGTGGTGAQGATGATGAQGTTGSTGSGFSTISPAYNNSIIISNGSSNSAFTNSNIYVSGDTIYAGAYYQNSSRELKTNITPFDKDAIELLKRVSVVTFYYKNDTFTPHIGFIAEDTPTELSGVNQNMMDVASVTGTLIKAVQELQAQNDSLVARIEALENK